MVSIRSISISKLEVKIGENMEDDTKLTVSRTREDGSTEIIWEIGLAELHELQQAFPRQIPVEAGEYVLAINIGKST